MNPSFAPASERVLGPGEYLLGVLVLAVALAALAFAAVRLRRALLPGWAGPPALVADVVLCLALALLLGELLGTFELFTRWGYLVGALAAAALAPFAAGALERRARPLAPAPPAPPLPRYGMPVVAVVVALVFAGWAIPTLTGLAGGMGRADSLWYHMPLSARFLQTGDTWGYQFFDPIFFAHFYPANSELWHAIPLLAFERDFVSPVLNLGFLALGLLACWAIGRPFGVAPQALLGGAVVLGAETMTDFQAGEALNDIVGVALLLCAAAVVVNSARASEERAIAGGALLVAGIAVGMAAGTKLSFVAPAAAFVLAVAIANPRGLRDRAGIILVVGAALGGGYWYLRNLVLTGNPLPLTAFGPLDLPSPERAFELRPGFSVAHYWNDTEVWREWFFPYLAEELGPLWPLILIGTVGGGIYAVWRGGDAIVRALGAVAVLTAVAYVFTPLTAGGEEGEPISFEWNIRYLAPAVAIGLSLLPCLPALRSTPGRRAATLAALVLLAAVTTLSIVQWPEGGHRKGAIATGLVVLGLFAAAAFARGRGWLGPAAARRSVIAIAAACLAGLVTAGFVVERHYLERRYSNLSPQLNIAEAVRWARDLRDARIAISGVRGVFNQYAFYGTDLSNHVQWLGIEGPDDAFLRIPDCATWREELNAGDYDFVVTMYDPYDPRRGGLTDTKEALWTRTDPAAREVLRDGPVSVFEIQGELNPERCAGLPDLSAPELNGDSVNIVPHANQPPPAAGRRS
ncbi:MAG TPA: hypothetical protein VIL04_06415 [Solirubrobacterales bacterium]